MIPVDLMVCKTMKLPRVVENSTRRIRIRQRKYFHNIKETIN